MARKLLLSDDLSMPVDAVTETFALLAVRGAGKTNAARVLAEEFFAAKVPFVAIDPVGSWWGLRSSRDGKHPGIPIPIFGGRHGDVQLDRNGGKLMADLIVDSRLSCIVDVSELDSEGARQAFLYAFAKRLYARNTEPLHLFLEEADDYIPQKPMRDELRLLRAWEDIVRRGRARGLGLTILTQRSAVVNKNVLTQVGTLIAMRTVSPQDRDAVEAWLKHHAQNREIIDSLPSLKNGEAWVWSPQFLGKTERVRFRLSHTFDSGETPKLRASRRAPATLADVDLGEIRTAMEEVVAEAERNDPKVLQKRIAELEAKLAKRPEPKVKVEVQKVPAISDKAIDQLQEFAQEADDASNDARAVVTLMEAVAKRFEDTATEMMEALRDVGRTEDESDMRIAKQRLKEIEEDPSKLIHDPIIDGVKRRGSIVRPARASDHVAALPKGARAMLTALQQMGKLSKTQVATLCGLRPKGRTFSNYLSLLRTNGLIVESGDQMELSSHALATIEAPDRKLTAQDVVAMWRGRFPAGARDMLDLLLAAYPKGMQKLDLAEKVGIEPKGRTFSNYMSLLRSNGLIEESDGGMLVTVVGTLAFKNRP